MPPHLLTELRPFQKQGVNQIDRFNGRSLLADDLGLGKTIQSLAWMIRNRIHPLIVVCPAVLKYQWEAQALMHFNVRSEILEGRRPEHNRICGPARITIINYDILEAWLDVLIAMNPQGVIVDECAAVKNRKAKRTKAVQKLCENVPHIIAVSGTPMLNRPVELYNALNLVRPDVFRSFFKFATRYCAPKKTPWGWQFKGATNVPELHALLKRTCMIRRLKKDVLQDLPPKTRSVIPMDISNRQEYSNAVSNFRKWLIEKHGQVRANKALRAEALTQMGYLKRLAARLKLEEVEKWIDNFLEETDEKLVVFGIHTSVIDQLHQKYKDISVTLTGQTPHGQRKRTIEQFKSMAETRLLIANIDVGGLGLNLQFASNVAIIELPWTPGQCTQAEDRVYRIGQVNPANIYYLVARNTIEVQLCDLIQKKQEVLTAVLDGDGNGEELDILDQLMRNIIREVA